MLLDKPLGCEQCVIAYRHLIIKGHLHNLALLGVLTCILYKEFESIEVMDGSVH